MWEYLDANMGGDRWIYVVHLDLCECNKIVVFEDKLLVAVVSFGVLIGLNLESLCLVHCPTVGPWAFLLD